MYGVVNRVGTMAYGGRMVTVVYGVVGIMVTGICVVGIMVTSIWCGR